MHFYPFVLKGNRNNIPPTLKDRIVELGLYKTLRARAEGEERRLLYVGMTRAKDCLCSFSYNGRFGDNGKYKWLINAGLNPSTKNVWGSDEFKPIDEMIRRPDDKEIPRYDDRTYSILKKPAEHPSLKKRYLSPSKIEEFDGYASHFSWEERGTEMDHKGWGDDYAIIGSCIHDIFAVYHPDHQTENHAAAINIIGGYGLSGILAGHIDALLSSADWLYRCLQNHFPQTEEDGVCTEYPFQMTLPTSQTLRGEIDLLWFYSDEKGKHCVLVDYKTFPGVDMHEHTKGHYAQLSAYVAALRNVGISVEHALVYYPVHGVVHELRD